MLPQMVGQSATVSLHEKRGHGVEEKNQKPFEKVYETWKRTGNDEDNK